MFLLIYNLSVPRMNLYELKENRIMKPKTFSAMLSNLLYEKRFGPYFVEPVIAGLDPYTNQPYVCNMDLVSYLMYRQKESTCGLAYDAETRASKLNQA